ncbi:MAG: hypothetical protein JXQ65_15685 [Candidatus Marinimicrobia bacterium]|nr:hypothetical protein [Candidatus Neomarinimicrobiota bacterium]
MLLKMVCKNRTGKEIVMIGQMLLLLGLGCTAGKSIINHFVSIGDFLSGFLTGFGAVMMGASIVVNITGMKMQRNAQ